MPVNINENIFGALFEWRKVPEDYFSKSLVMILKELQRLDGTGEALTAHFLSSVFGIPFISKELMIDDHVGQTNRPDIIVSDSNSLVYIEVKVDDKLKNSDLEGYRSEVTERAKSNGQSPFLFGLTRFGHDDIPSPDIINGQISWIGVWQNLKDIESNLTSDFVDGNKAPKAFFMIQDFTRFLKENGMGVEQITKIFNSGDLRHFLNLTSLVKAGCQAAGLKLDNERNPRMEISDGDKVEDSYIGWWFKPKNREKGQDTIGYWCGFYINQPSELVFEVTGPDYENCYRKLLRRKNKLDSQFPGWDIDKVNCCAGFTNTIPSEFTELEASQQVEWVSKFVNSVLEAIS